MRFIGMDVHRDFCDTLRQLIEKGQFRDALQMDIDNIRDLFVDKYERAIEEMLRGMNESRTPWGSTGERPRDDRASLLAAVAGVDAMGGRDGAPERLPDDGAGDCECVAAVLWIYSTEEHGHHAPVPVYDR